MSEEANLRTPGKADAEAGTDDALSRAAIGLPPLSDAGEDLGHADQGHDHPARPGARLFARRRGRLHGDQARPDGGVQPDFARQPGRGDHQRHGGARARQHRRARRQAGDGRQGLPVQEVRRHRRVRHRDRRDRPRQAGRDHRQPRADLRRHQPRGHQGARVLRDRDAAARAHEDPGLPRRPARHGDRRGRGRAQRAQGRRQAASRTSSSSAPARAPRRIACLEHPGEPGPAQGEHPGHGQQGRASHERPDRSTSRRRATPRRPRARTLAETSSRAPTSSSASRSAGVLKPEMVASMAAAR